MAGKQVKKQLSSIGFHYYDDSEHYRKPDLENLLSAIKDFNKPWVVLQSEVTRSIPEFFLKGLHEYGAKTIVQLKAHVNSIENNEDLTLLLHQYGDWGVSCTQLAGFPNMKSYWGNSWLKINVVDEFYAGFLAFAKLSISEGIAPLMSTLVPGGDFWDTVFLHTILKRMAEDNQGNVLQNLSLAAGGWTFGQSLDYGLGGHDVYSDVRPYHVPSGYQSQIGLHAYEWYLEISREVLGRNMPTFLFHLGETYPGTVRPGLGVKSEFEAGVEKVATYLIDEEGALAYGEWVPAGVFSGIPKIQKEEIQEESGERKSQLLKKMSEITFDFKKKNTKGHVPVVKKTSLQKENKGTEKFITHYLLLPVYDWGIAEWHLEVIKPFIQNHRPTIGFSIEEACHANKVTVVGDETVFSVETEELLKESGCVVERISGDGTEVASQMTAR